jgi:hypothetical protein
MNTNDQQQDEVIDLESYGKANKPVPTGKRYQIKIDKQLYQVAVSELTGREILALAAKTPEKYILQQKIGSSVHRVGADEVVSLLKPGVERFMTIPNEVTEGETEQLRRDFEVLPQDLAYLSMHGLTWEAILEDGVQRVAIRGWPLPCGYNVEKVDVYVRLEAGYPDTQIDMAYFFPHLARADQRPINALSSEQFGGQNWQRWSRHRTGNSAWRMGEDNLGTHMELVVDWLRTELLK